MAGEELAVDIAAAWPEEDDLTLAGAAQPEEEEDDAVQSEEIAHEEDAEPSSERQDEDADPAPDEGDSAGAEEGDSAQSSQDEDLQPAPMSLPADAREAWKDTPPAMRSAIQKREQQYEQGIRKYAHQAKRAEQMDAKLAPYQPLFSANGNKPGELIDTLLQTATTLQMGSPMQKADMMNRLINNFGVDIQMLDNLIVGNNTPEMQTQQQMQQMMQPFQQQMQQLQTQQQQFYQQQNQQLETEALSSVEQFANDPANEFYNEVSPLMADLMDLEANKGGSLTLQEAYDKAVSMTPAVQAIINSRTTQANLEKKRHAASSTKGSASSEVVDKVPKSLRGSIDAAWDAASRP